MKRLILSISSMLWLSVQANAQPAASPSVNVNSSITGNKATASKKTGSITDTNVNVSTYINNQQDQGEDLMKSKTFSKSFSLGKDDKVNLSNQFGSITIKTWDKKEIKVDADIKAFANTDTEAQKLIDEATINATKTGDVVTFKTDIGDNKGSWGNGSRNGKRWRREVKIYLTVYMPASNSLTAAQKYGNITMDSFSGPTSLKVEFGNLIGSDLSNSNNYISVQYGKTTLKDINQAKIKLQFGDGLTIQNIGTMDLDAQYVAVNIGTVKDAIIKQRFGKGLTIGAVGSLNLDAQYTTVKMTTLRGNATNKIQFGKFFIDEIETGCKNFDINAQHSDLSLGFATNYNANFDIATSFGGFKFSDNVSVKKIGDEGKRYISSKSYAGQIGKGGVANVSIKTQYGSVTFK